MGKTVHLRVTESSLKVTALAITAVLGAFEQATQIVKHRIDLTYSGLEKPQTAFRHRNGDGELQESRVNICTPCCT